MAKIVAQLRRGADWRIGIEPIAPAVASDVATVTANAKRALTGPGVPPQDTAEAFDWVPVARAAAGDIAAGWDLTLPDTASAAIEPGIYCSTIELTFTSGLKDRETAFYFEVEEVTL